jgi:hypothetical protein
VWVTRKDHCNPFIESRSFRAADHSGKELGATALTESEKMIGLK